MVTEQSQLNGVAWRRRPFMVFLTNSRQFPGIRELWTPLSWTFPSHHLDSSPLTAVCNLYTWYNVIKRTNKQHHFYFSFWTGNIVILHRHFLLIMIYHNQDVPYSNRPNYGLLSPSLLRSPPWPSSFADVVKHLSWEFGPFHSMYMLQPISSVALQLFCYGCHFKFLCHSPIYCVVYNSVSQPLWDHGPVNSFFIRRGPRPNKFSLNSYIKLT